MKTEEIQIIDGKKTRIHKPDSKPLLVTFGKGGHTVYFAKNGNTTARESGYDTPENFFAVTHWWADAPDLFMLSHDPESFEGCPVIDKRAAVETVAGIKMAISGPMVDCNLPDGEIDKCPDPSPEFATAVAGNQFGSLLAMRELTKGKRAGALDCVSRSEYVQLWREAGAKIGICRNGAITWE